MWPTMQTSVPRPRRGTRRRRSSSYGRGDLALGLTAPLRPPRSRSRSALASGADPHGGAVASDGLLAHHPGRSGDRDDNAALAQLCRGPGRPRQADSGHDLSMSDAPGHRKSGGGRGALDQGKARTPVLRDDEAGPLTQMNTGITIGRAPACAACSGAGAAR